MRVELGRPAWLKAVQKQVGEVYPKSEERLGLAIALSRRNVEEGTGGPFGAAVFESSSGRLVAIGVNHVEALGLSLAHAEMMALAWAQKRLGSYDLGQRQRHELVSSAQPCAMCTGAVLWSGVTRLVYAATKEDVESIVGFDEGPIPRNWKNEYKRRGIAISAGRKRRSACAVLRLYKDRNGTIYAGRHGVTERVRSTASYRGARRHSKRQR